MNRRNWLKNAAGLLVAAPAIVRASSLMPLGRVWDCASPVRGGVLSGSMATLSLMGDDGSRMVREIALELLDKEISFQVNRAVQLISASLNYKGETQIYALEHRPTARSGDTVSVMVRVRL